MRLSWLACYDPADGTSRMCTWTGDTARIVVTGLPVGFAANAPMSFELPDGAAIHGVPPRDCDRHGVPMDGPDPGRRLAAGLGGVLFTVFKRHAIELLMDQMSQSQVFVTVTPEQAAAHARILAQYPNGVIPLGGEPASRAAIRAKLDAGVSIPDILAAMRTPEEAAAYDEEFREIDEHERSMAEHDAERESEK